MRHGFCCSDGKEPSDKEMEQYAKDKLKQTEDLKKYPERSPLGVKTMVQPGSLELLEDQNDRWLFLFTPTEEIKKMRKMQGQLLLISRETIWNGWTFELKSLSKQISLPR